MLRLNPQCVAVDAVEFEEAIDEDRAEDALAIYRGSFMTGVHVNGVSTFGDWRDGREREYRRAALAAALALADREPANGDRESRSQRWLERAIDLAPFEDEPVRRLIQRLLARGDGAGAVSVFRDHDRRLSSLGLKPAPATMELIDTFVDRSDARGAEENWGDPVTATAISEMLSESEPVGAAATSRGPAGVGRTSVRTSVRLGLVLVATGLLAWTSVSQRAHADGLERMRALVATGDYVEAHRTALQLDPRLAGDEVFEALWDQATYRLSVTTAPEPAQVAIRDYSGDSDSWIDLGTTPLDKIRIPAVYLRWRIERPGRPAEERAALDASARDHIHFESSPSQPREGMAYVSAMH